LLDRAEVPLRRAGLESGSWRVDVLVVVAQRGEQVGQVVVKRR
jgi:hypothetical protein